MFSQGERSNYFIARAKSTSAVTRSHPWLQMLTPPLVSSASSVASTQSPCLATASAAALIVLCICPDARQIRPF